MVKNRVRIAEHIAEIRHVEKSIMNHYRDDYASERKEKLADMWDDLIECLKNLDEKTS